MAVRTRLLGVTGSKLSTAGSLETRVFAAAWLLNQADSGTPNSEYFRMKFPFFLRLLGALSRGRPASLLQNKTCPLLGEDPDVTFLLSTRDVQVKAGVRFSDFSSWIARAMHLPEPMWNPDVSLSPLDSQVF